MGDKLPSVKVTLEAIGRRVETEGGRTAPCAVDTERKGRTSVQESILSRRIRDLSWSAWGVHGRSGHQCRDRWSGRCGSRQPDRQRFGAHNGDPCRGGSRYRHRGEPADELSADALPPRQAKAASSAISTMSPKLRSRSSAGRASPVIRWSDTVRTASARRL